MLVTDKERRAVKILLISDIHANYPALKAVAAHEAASGCNHVWNCGDVTVYAPFPNETIDWLKTHKAISILGNTDRKVLKLVRGKQFKKPRKPEKRIMYTWTHEVLTKENIRYLQSLGKKNTFKIKGLKVGLFHGSPADPDEFLFPDTPEERLSALSRKAGKDIICFGHSHTPFHNNLHGVHFINPGSVGRMFDGNPAASFAVIKISGKKIKITHHRVPWDFREMEQGFLKSRLPEIYISMYRQGLKLN